MFAHANLQTGPPQLERDLVSTRLTRFGIENTIWIFSEDFFWRADSSADECSNLKLLIQNLSKAAFRKQWSDRRSPRKIGRLATASIELIELQDQESRKFNLNWPIASRFPLFLRRSGQGVRWNISNQKPTRNRRLALRCTQMHSKRIHLFRCSAHFKKRFRMNESSGKFL